MERTAEFKVVQMLGSFEAIISGARAKDQGCSAHWWEYLRATPFAVTKLCTAPRPPGPRDNSRGLAPAIKSCGPVGDASGHEDVYVEAQCGR